MSTRDEDAEDERKADVLGEGDLERPSRRKRGVESRSEEVNALSGGRSSGKQGEDDRQEHIGG